MTPRNVRILAHLYTSSAHACTRVHVHMRAHDCTSRMLRKGIVKWAPTCSCAHTVMCTPFAHGCTFSAHQGQEPVSDAGSLMCKSPVRALAGASALCVRATPL